MSTYKQNTPLLNIPVVGHGDRISPEIELYRYKIIENLLIAGMQGVKKSIFSEGFFNLEEIEDNIFSLSLFCTGSSLCAISGIVEGKYFTVPKKIEWANLDNGKKYYLYIASTRHTRENPSDVRSVAVEKPINSDTHILIAHLDLTNEDKVLDKSPRGKLYSHELSSHVSKIQNPHGQKLYQNELVITDKLIFANKNDKSPMVEIEIDGKISSFPANLMPEAIGQLAGRAVEIIDFESFGKEGGVIIVSGRSEIFNVCVHRRVVGNFDGQVGEIGIGYFGEDDKADQANEFVVYNSSDNSIPMRAIVFCR